jgi:hypothetical protein
MKTFYNLIEKFFQTSGWLERFAPGRPTRTTSPRAGTAHQKFFSAGVRTPILFFCYIGIASYERQCCQHLTRFSGQIVLTNSAAGNYFFALKIKFTILDGIRPREKNFVCHGGGHDIYFYFSAKKRFGKN